MNILISSYSFYPDPRGNGGAEKQGRILAKELHRLGHDVAYVTSGIRSQPNFEIVDGIAIHRICTENRFARRIMPYLWYFKLKRFICSQKKRYDIVQSMGAWDTTAPAVVAAARKINSKSVVRYASVNEEERLQQLGIFGKWFIKKLRMANYKLTNSNVTLSVMTTRYSLLQSQCRVIRNIVEPFELLDKSDVRKKLGLPFNKKIALCVSNFHPGKNQEGLLESWVLVCKKNKNTLLLLIGAGVLENKCREKTALLGIDNEVVFLGKKNNVKEYLAAADLFVFPSAQEGQSNALLEAMAAGLPIAISDNELSRQTIETGKEAIGFDSKNTDEMAAAIERIITDKRFSEAIGKAAKIRVERDHAPEKIALEYLDVYNRIVE